MLKLSLDVDMKDVSPTSTTDDRTYGTFTEDDGRSPRTPTYVPTSPTFSKVTAFDPSRIFSSPETFDTRVSPSTFVPEPAKPLAWIWQCHLCKSRYPLSVTRRCLQDGHFYCSGEMDRPNLKRRKRGQSCSSEFDYIGWKEWSEWKRKVLSTLENGIDIHGTRKGCQRCEYPSQCRHNSGHASAQNTAVMGNNIEALTDSAMIEASRISSFDEETKKSSVYSTGSVTFDTIFASAAAEQEQLQPEIADFLNDADLKPDKHYSKSITAKTACALLDRVIRSAEKRSGKKWALSPIAEEFCSRAEHTNDVFGEMAFDSWNDIVGVASSKENEDQMDLS
jgi:hypothetical protein